MSLLIPIQANAEKLCRTYEDHLNETKTKLDEMTRLMNDLTTQKTKLQSENGMCSISVFSPNKLLVSRMSSVYVKEKWCAVVLVLNVAGLGLLNRIVALHLPIFLSSVFM